MGWGWRRLMDGDELGETGVDVLEMGMVAQMYVKHNMVVFL